MEFWSVIKYKPKAGCEEEFIDNLKPLKRLLEGRREQADYVQLPTGEVAESEPQEFRKTSMPKAEKVNEAQLDLFS